jgi:hypothetical protein
LKIKQRDSWATSRGVPADVWDLFKKDPKTKKAFGEENENTQATKSNQPEAPKRNSGRRKATENSRNQRELKVVLERIEPSRDAEDKPGPVDETSKEQRKSRKREKPSEDELAPADKAGNDQRKSSKRAKPDAENKPGPADETSKDPPAAASHASTSRQGLVYSSFDDIAERVMKGMGLDSSCFLLANF